MRTCCTSLLVGIALLGDNGFARIVAPNDVRAGRFVSNLTSLEVFHALPVPEPSTWLLMCAGMFIVAMRRRAETARRA